MDEVIDDTIDACAQCGAKQATATDLVADEVQFEVNKTCGHKFCKNCLHDQFTNQGKRQFACAKCQSLGQQVMVKREKLSKKSLEDEAAMAPEAARRALFEGAGGGQATTTTLAVDGAGGGSAGGVRRGDGKGSRPESRYRALRVRVEKPLLVRRQPSLTGWWG